MNSVSGSALVVLVIFLACAGCEDPDEPPTPPPPTPTPSPVPGEAAADPAPAPAAAASTLLAAFDATIAAPHRMRATMTGNPHGPTDFVAEAQPPDRMRMVMEVAPGRSIETIVIGDQVWSNAMGGRFMRLPGGAAASARGADVAREMRNAITDGRTSFHLVGPEALDGQPTTVWEGTGPMNLGTAGPAQTGTGRVWIGADGRMLRSRAEGDVDGDHITIDIRYEYDDAIRIEPPTDVVTTPMP